jgi:ParB family chromosome partitioning protein
VTRRGLGRGLSALIAASEDWGEGVTQISVEAIVPNPDQPRRGIAEESLAELAASIREHGVLQPLIVEPLADGSYRLIAGERRWRAARLAGLATVPAIVREVNEEQRIELALVENVQREDINPVEEAMAYRALMERFGLTQEQVAQRVGKSRTAVANTLRLLSLPSEVLESLATGVITEGHARALLMAPEEARLRLFQSAVQQRWSVREMERAARLSRAQREAQRKESVSRETPHPDPNILALEERLRDSLATRVRIEFRNGRGTIHIDFFNEDDFARIMERIIGSSASIG